MKSLLGFTAALALGATSGFAAAQQFPSRVVTIIVPFGAGGGTDQVARVLAPKIAESVGQPVIVENKPGGNGQVAIAALKNAPADGHTVLMVSQGIVATNPWIYPALAYDPQKDLAPVTLLYSSTHLLLVPAASPAKSAKDLVAQAKGKPGGLSFGSVGVGSGAHIAAEMWKQAASVEAVHIPYKGSGDLLPNLLAARLDYGFDGPSQVAPMIKDGRIRPLAITDSKRWAAFPDVPTMAEAGYPGVEVNSWFGLVARAGTPKPAIDRLFAEFVKALAAPDVQKRLADLVNQPTPSKSPEEFAALIAAERERHGRIVKAANIKAE
jgi:tripartite-type tricarboxylate transporter receptor subunit TctC